MAYDIGDTAHLAISVTDSTGAPANATTVVCTITLPDATTATPTVANPQPGSYAVDYPITQAGRHTISWVGTGSNAFGQSDAFEVSLGDPGYLISLADAKAMLRITNTNNDERIRLYLEAASGVVAYYRGDIARQTYTESHDGGDVAVYLRHTPVLTITAVTEYVGNIVYTLTNQPPGSSVNAWGYSLDDAASGRVVRRTASGQAFRFVPGDANVTVTYTTGVPVIPATVRVAVELIVSHLWENNRGAQPVPARAGSNESMVPGVNYAIPNDAIELLETASRNPVIA